MFYLNVSSTGNTIKQEDKYFKRKWLRSDILYITIKRNIQSMDGTKGQLKFFSYNYKTETYCLLTFSDTRFFITN